MSKPRTETFDRRLAARLLAAGEPAVLVAELLGMPRLELEAARSVDPDLRALEDYYRELESWPAERRLARARKLFLLALEHALERGEIRGLGWAARLLGCGRDADPAATSAAEEDEADEVAAVTRTLSPEERVIWDELDYSRWPVPPKIPRTPDAPPCRGPLEVPNDAGTEAERMRAPIPWPPRRPPEARASAAEPEGAAAGEAASPAPAPAQEPEREGPARWPPHLRPL
ncbi:MAG: hypothetical protein RMK73_13275 [Geminicoccaceae bacterium]|nr:hypothetical protein [Geminicoccaceae bacterium]MDW8342447.1 hypothetical protein [Geminicoccaceae bacterium]